MSGYALKVALLSFAHPHAVGYAEVLAADPGVDLVIADPDGAAEDPTRGRAVAGRLGVRYVDGYALALDGADAAVVCSENAGHRELVLQSARAGVAVLCEKPLATTVPDAAEMVRSCADAGVPLMTAYPVRFSPAFAALRTQVASGRLGRLLGVLGTNNGKLPEGREWFTDPARSGGGATVDHVVHCADLLDALLGGVLPEAVYAVTSAVLHPAVGVETAGLVTLTYPGGLVATIDCSWSRPPDAPTWGGLTLQVAGTSGMVGVDPFALHVGGHAGGREVWLPYGPDLDAAMLGEFLDAVAGGRVPQPDGGAGLRTVRIMVAAQESARTGRVVRPAG